MQSDLPERGPILQALSELLQGGRQTLSVYELDGMACGLVCTPAGANDPGPSRFGELLELNPSNPRPLAELLGLCRAHLERSDCDFCPLLPGDEAAMSERAEAIGVWCQGFLAGFGAVAGPADAETEEVLADLSAISQVDSDIDESDDAAWDMERVIEYLRVAVMDLYLGSQTDASASRGGETLH